MRSSWRCVHYACGLGGSRTCSHCRRLVTGRSLPLPSHRPSRCHPPPFPPARRPPALPVQRLDGALRCEPCPQPQRLRLRCRQACPPTQTRSRCSLCVFAVRQHQCSLRGLSRLVGALADDDATEGRLRSRPSLPTRRMPLQVLLVPAACSAVWFWLASAVDTAGVKRLADAWCMHVRRMLKNHACRSWTIVAHPCHAMRQAARLVRGCDRRQPFATCSAKSCESEAART